MSRRVALVTWSERSPHADPENDAIVRSLSQHGIEGILVPWRTERCPEADLCIVRTPWDYTEDLPGFLAWLDEAEKRMPVANPPRTVRWNAHKRYLLELAARGVPVPQTLVVPPGGRAAAAEEWPEAVVKPAISAAGRNTYRVRGDAVRATLASATGDSVVQPYLPAIETEGERSLVYFDGTFSHAVVKRPAKGEFRIQAYYGGVTQAHAPTQAEFAAAERVLAAVEPELLYARVDLLPDASGPLLMELEVIEPFFYTTIVPAAAERFAAAVARRLGA